MTTIPLVFYGLLLVATLTGISLTCYHYPLFPFQTDNLDWSVAWLLATVVDYYGSTLCLSGIVLASESSWIVGVAWVLGFCLLGSPLCCLWVILRLVRGGTLRIEQKPSSADSLVGTENERLS